MTQVFVVIKHFIATPDINGNVLMQPTCADSDNVINITVTYLPKAY